MGRRPSAPPFEVYVMYLMLKAIKECNGREAMTAVRGKAGLNQTVWDRYFATAQASEWARLESRAGDGRETPRLTEEGRLFLEELEPGMRRALKPNLLAEARAQAAREGRALPPPQRAPPSPAAPEGNSPSTPADRTGED